MNIRLTISFLVPMQFSFYTPRSDVVAVVDPSAKSHEWVRANLGAEVQLFSTPKEMYKHFDCQHGAKPMSGRLDAVVISTETSLHATLACEAISYGLHTLLEKPISTTPDGDRQVAQASAKRPEVKLVVAMSRRFDPSYRAAFARLSRGECGEAFMIRSATIDQYDESGWFVPYSLKSGGIFVDCGIHDIDIARWFLGLSNAAIVKGAVRKPDVRPAKCYAIGYNALHKELSQYGDADSAVGTVQLTDGRSFTIQLGRTALHGHECSMQLFGTKGWINVNQNPVLDRNQILDRYGVRTESTPSYMERFGDALITEAREFTEHCLDDLPMCVTLDDAIQAARIAQGLTLALRSGLPVSFDETGVAIQPAGATGASAGTAIRNTTYDDKAVGAAAPAPQSKL